MKVRVTKAFPWAADGNTVRMVQVGEVLEERGAVVALQMKAGVVLDDEPPVEGAKPPPANKPKPKPKPKDKGR